MSECEDDELLKAEVRACRNEHPCGTQFIDLERGSKGFFDEANRFRHASQSFMNSLAGLDAFRGKKSLEAGCGLGIDLLQFMRGGAIVTGIDLMPRSIELVKHRIAIYQLPVEALVTDTGHLPFGDRSFDIAYSFGVLHHTPNTRRAVSEAHCILKHGGSAIIMLYHRNSLHYAPALPCTHCAGYRVYNGKPSARIACVFMMAQTIPWARLTTRRNRVVCSDHSAISRSLSATRSGKTLHRAATDSISA
jgi:SAM-dependent methyltransferase